MAGYFYGGHPEELNLGTLPPWLHNSWITAAHPTNVGWLICQAILAGLLALRLSRWRDADEPHSNLATVKEQVRAQN